MKILKDQDMIKVVCWIHAPSVRRSIPVPGITHKINKPRSCFLGNLTLQYHSLFCERNLVGDAILVDLHSFYMLPINSTQNQRTNEIKGLKCLKPLLQ